MLSLLYVLAALFMSSTFSSAPSLAYASPLALAEGPAGTGGGGPDPCISGHLCHGECCRGRCDPHTGGCFDPDACGTNECDHRYNDCLNGTTCCPKDASCGSICCFDSPMSFFNQVCKNKSIGLCCYDWQIEAGGICCSPGEINVRGQCLREIKLCPGGSCESPCVRFPELCNTTFSG